VACLVVTEQWAPEDTSTPIKPDSRKAAAGSASRTLDDADRSLAAAGIYLITCLILYLHIYTFLYFHLVSVFIVYICICMYNSLFLGCLLFFIYCNVCDASVKHLVQFL